MKKDLYRIVGVVALAIVAFVVAINFYQNSDSSKSAVSSQEAVSKVDSKILVKEWSPSIGPTIARVVLVEFLDPECESCRAMHPIVKGVLKKYDGRIRYVVRYMPFHANSKLAASWLEAAREQGKFWEGLDALFVRQPEWAAHHDPKPSLIPEILKDVGVDIIAATIAKDNPEYATRISQDKEDGVAAGVTGTPTFFVNGTMLRELGETSLIAAIESELGAE